MVTVEEEGRNKTLLRNGHTHIAVFLRARGVRVD